MEAAEASPLNTPPGPAKSAPSIDFPKPTPTSTKAESVEKPTTYISPHGYDFGTSIPNFGPPMVTGVPFGIVVSSLHARATVADEETTTAKPVPPLAPIGPGPVVVEASSEETATAKPGDADALGHFGPGPVVFIDSAAVENTTTTRRIVTNPLTFGWPYGHTEWLTKSTDSAAPTETNHETPDVVSRGPVVFETLGPRQDGFKNAPPNVFTLDPIEDTPSTALGVRAEATLGARQDGFKNAPPNVFTLDPIEDTPSTALGVRAEATEGPFPGPEGRVGPQMVSGDVEIDGNERRQFPGPEGRVGPEIFQGDLNGN